MCVRVRTQLKNMFTAHLDVVVLVVNYYLDLCHGPIVVSNVVETDKLFDR